MCLLKQKDLENDLLKWKSVHGPKKKKEKNKKVAKNY